MEKLSQIELVKQTHPGLSALNPFDIAGEYSEKPVTEFRGDLHYALQICIVLHGSAEVMLENFRKSYNEGEIWWNMCWEPHAYHLTSKRSFVLAINLDLEQLSICSPFRDCNWLLPFTAQPQDRYLPATEKERAVVLGLGKKLFHLNQRRKDGEPINQYWGSASWLIIHELLLFAVEHMDARLSKDADKNNVGVIPRIKNVLNQVWLDDHIPPGLCDAAKLCALSSSRFSELFRQVMGMSYGKFALRVRLSNAAKDLLAERFSLDEIAQKWGFFDTAHFCHAFKKNYCVSPRQYVTRSGKNTVKPRKSKLLQIGTKQNESKD